MIVITVDGLNWRAAEKFYKDLFPVQSMKKIYNNVRRFSHKGNPTTLGLGCLWSGEPISKFHENLYYKVSEENRAVEWKLKNGQPMDLIFNHFSSPKFYEKVAGPSPYHNFETYQHEYDNVPAKKVECEEYCIFLETAKRDYDLFWIHTSIIKTGVMMPGPYEQGRIPSVIPYDVIRNNKKQGLHTLILLDIHGEKNRFMTANEGIELLFEMENKLKKNVFNKNSILCVVARAGSSDPIVRADVAAILKDEDFGKPLHTLVVPGNLHFIEVESLMKIAGLPAEIGKKLQKL